MHRLLPAWCAAHGARVGEIRVHHRPRVHGRSKYGRTFKVLLDLMTTKFMSGYLGNPSYAFGSLAFLFYILGFVSTALVFYDKFGPNHHAPLRIPGLLLTCLFGIVGTLLLLIGLLAEVLVRVYYGVIGQEPYQVRSVHSRDPEASSTSSR